MLPIARMLGAVALLALSSLAAASTLTAGGNYAGTTHSNENHSNQNLTGVTLDGATLTGTNFSRTIFDGGSLIGANFSNSATNLTVSQVVPFPYTAKSELVRRYQATMRKNNDAKFSHASLGRLAPVVVPHVAHDDRRLARVP